MAAGLLRGGRDELTALFDELAEELAGFSVLVEVLMVGGSWLLWFGEREATRDVDSARPLSAEVAAAIARVAERHDIDPDWLNDKAVPFLPHNFDTAACTTVYQHDALVVQIPSAETIFLMKLHRAGAPDREDMITIWSRCAFTGPDEVVANFFEAYPHAPEDPHLGEYVAAIIDDAGEN